MACTAIGLAGPILVAHGLGMSAPAFLGDEVRESREGYAALAWEDGSGEPFELERARDPDFTHAVLVYRGRARSTFVSGLRDGTYHFRVRAHGSAWSAPIRLHVAHHPMHLALACFTAGAAVFLATTVFLAIAARGRAR